MDKILKSICVGLELSESRSGNAVPISPKERAITDWFISSKPEICRGTITIPVAITATLICCSKDAKVLKKKKFY